MPSEFINCPICRSAMQKRAINGGLELDYCDRHGVWLDAGELERILATFGGGSPGGQGGVGKSIAQNLAGAAVVGAGFSIGHRLVGGIVDALFSRR